mgnify:CR=1 FL=1
MLFKNLVALTAAFALPASVAAATVGTPCEEVDRVGRTIIADAGYGEYFVHRTGHGIGLEEHEDPYIVEGNGLPLEAGHAFSVEPGIYIPGWGGIRIEDDVVVTEDAPQVLTTGITKQPDDIETLMAERP